LVIKSYCQDIPGDLPYPIIADETQELAVNVDMVDEDNTNNEAEVMTVHHWARSQAHAVHAVPSLSWQEC
jgi:alkyl hydroperoxide reductase subunit AhpC